MTKLTPYEKSSVWIEADEQWKDLKQALYSTNLNELSNVSQKLTDIVDRLKKHEIAVENHCDNQLVKALDAAQDFTDIYGGFASVGLNYDPYEGEWIAKADWSDRTKIVASHILPSEALILLTEKLKEHLREVKLQKEESK